MKNIIPFWLVEFANKVAKIPLLKTVLKPFYYYYKQKINSKRCDNFHKYGTQILFEFDKCMNENGFQYMLFFGSLLGAIREKGFIAHDLDMDVIVFIENRTEKLYNCLERSGFRLSHRFSVDNCMLGCEETFLYKDTGVSLDIFYVYPPIEKYPYVSIVRSFEGCSTWRENMKKHGGLRVLRADLPIEHNILRVEFENIMVNIPQNYKNILPIFYGENYMIPDPNYVPPQKYSDGWEDKLAKYEEF